MDDSREQVRVITTIGHVDHGKTTFVDSLLVANNIISARMAGKIRYMDSRDDEQQRGITMESSAVSLKFKMLRATDSTLQDYVINLIDTPGHVDFSTEVSAASRLCDGALVLVDVVEGVCTQTVTVLKQAWLDRLQPILVINKCDRLITELKLTPVEAYNHLQQLIEQVNAVMGSFFASERMEDDLRWREAREKRLADRKEKFADEAESATASDIDPDAEANAFEEKDDEDLYFLPDRGNVIFASAIDGWGFRIGKFAQLYAAKLGIKESNLRRVLWGDFYLDPKTKRVINHKHLRGRTLKPLFVQFVLDNLWAVYESVMLKPDADKVQKIVNTLNLKIPARDLKTKDARHLLSLVCSQWLPLSTSTFQAVVEVVPPPARAQRIRMPRLLHPDLKDKAATEPQSKVEEDLYGCDGTSEANSIAFVSKMFAVRRKDLPEHQRKALTAEEMRAKARVPRDAPVTTNDERQVSEDSVISTPNNNVDEESTLEEEEVMLGFSRLYSGVLRKGMAVQCILPKYDVRRPPSHPANAKYIASTSVTGLYIMMGRELVSVDEVVAGNVCAIGGLAGVIWRTGTICSPPVGRSLTHAKGDLNSECIVNLSGAGQLTTPIVRVALEPADPRDLPKLVSGLRLLSQADPCVETFQQQTGEYVILTAGELHLERCLKDLRERFAKVEIQASKPIVPFRETAVKGIDMPPPKVLHARRGTVTGSSAQNAVKFTIRACPLPVKVTDFLLSNKSIIKGFLRDSQGHGNKGRSDLKEFVPDHGAIAEVSDEIYRQPTVQPEEFWQTLETLLNEAGGDWSHLMDQIWAFGPHGIGPNILFDCMGGTQTSLMKRLRGTGPGVEGNATHRGAGQGAPAGSVMSDPDFLRDFDDSVETGFQIASFQGPLCSEPMQGMAFFVESVKLGDGSTDEHSIRTKKPQLTGSMISAVRDACRSGLLDWSPRLMLAMYACDIQAATDVLGKVYGVIAQRKGRVVAEEMNEGTSFFTISSLLPVVESFGFSDDIRKRSSGAASPQLIFSGYELLDQDPFWVPTTEEELEDLGEKADRANIAKGYMDAVRRRKGLFVEQKLVEHAEKQRTLKK